MTEAEWLASADPGPLLHWVRGKVSDRKLRLFAVACCRSADLERIDTAAGRAVEAAERFADDRVTESRLAEVHREYQPHRSRDASDLWQFSRGSELAAREVSQPDAWAAAWDVAWSARVVARDGSPGRHWDDERRTQAVLLREILGNPFRPSSVDPAMLMWNGGTVPNLARTIYDDRSFDRLPVLADALEDAGRTDAELVAHVRGRGPHVRGCWGLDLLTGRT